MAKVKIQGHASGTGVLTVTAPNTSTDRTITLPDATGTLLSSEGAVTINDSGADVDFRVEGSGAANALFVQGSDGKVGIGTNSPTSVFEISGTGAQYSKVANGSNKAYMGVAGDNKAYFGSFSATDVVLAHGTSNKWTLNSSGNLFPAATSQGIVLGNTSDVAANRLDDYEEGTWTPTFQGGTFTSHASTGRYVKIGNMVHIQYYSSNATISSVSGAARITNLPYAPLNASNHHTVISYCHGNAVTGAANIYLDYSNATMYWVINDGTSSPGWVSGSHKFLMLTGTYQTA